ncbi:MAG: histidine kinase dimerization/phospho-acceptor domain-containing protein, partial [Robiginitomaculum sp.]
MSGGPNDLNLPNDVNLTGVLEDLPLPLLVLDVSSHKILWTNANAEVWLGRSRRALIGRDLGFITDDLAALILPLSRVSEISGVVNAYDFLIKRPSGNVSKCQMTAYYFTGAFDGAIALYFREQDSKRPENLSEKNSDAVGALGRMLAHELKNPLSGIKGAAQLLASDASSAEDRELIALISTETDRIRRLADRMESFGDFDLKRRGPVNIHAILRQARLLAQSSTQAGLVFSEIYDPSLPLVDGDNDALMQVAINLIVNATEAMTSASTGREIRLETAYRSG